MSKIALFQEPQDDGSVCCKLCPRNCRIPEGKTGFCAVRINLKGTLYSLAYGYPVAMQIDPIEKKPLYHFLPGTKTFSIGTFGCNLGCCFCQNDGLSRGSYEQGSAYRHYPVQELVTLARLHSCQSMAFTYNEPTAWIEYVLEAAEAARANGLATCLVTNGYISEEAARVLYPKIDAANIDVKAFSNDFYKTMCKATLDPVLKSCVYFKRERKGHLEITNLLIPGKNDTPEQIELLLDWAKDQLGTDTPVHFSAYFPAYLYHESPPTPKATVLFACDMARSKGFEFVHAGNIR